MTTLPEAVPDLLAFVANFPGSDGQPDQHNALLAVLDALIQMNAPVPAADAQRLYTEFPVQSLILLASAGEDATPALLGIFKSDQASPAAWLAAGDLLVSRRAEGFAATVVEGMTVHAEVMVTDPGAGFGSGGSNVCCGAAPSAPSVGWPPVGVYAFAGGGDRAEPGATLLVAGTDPSYYHRQVNTAYIATDAACACHPDKDLVRQHYLTSLLYSPPEDPPVRANVTHTIIWQSVDAYTAELSAFVDDQQHVLTELARRLAEHNLLNEADAQMHLPRLDIRIEDQRATQDPPLPVTPPL